MNLRMIRRQNIKIVHIDKFTTYKSQFLIYKIIMTVTFKKGYIRIDGTFHIEFILFQNQLQSLLQQNRIIDQKRNVMDDSEDNQLEKQAEIYKRQRLLGSGSYGRAFLVKQIATDVQWVVKQINLADLMPNQQNQAMKEAKILQLLDHPNIIRFKEVYRTKKGKLNIVMQYAQNGDLALNIKKAKQTGSHFSQQTILNWFVQMCIGIKHIHQRKIIHRDLKPQNIFLSADNLIKIGDFGVARVMENTIAKARTVVGSPYYLSPQIIQNKPYSYKTDIWSLGTLLFQLCSLQPPFKANNIQFLALKIVQGSYSQIPRQYSQGLRMLIKSMLQTKESNRPNISQILSSRIVSERMRKFIAQQQQKLNNLNNTKKQSQTMSYFNMGQLKSPPNLMNLEIGQNKSQIIMSKNIMDNESNEQTNSPIKIKAKTPQVIIRKGPNNFMHRPPSSKRKIQSNNELADLIQIKPSIIQTHDKVQKINHVVIPLPKVPKPIKIPKITKQIHPLIKQPQKAQIKLKQVQKGQIKNLNKPSSGFSKKRISFTNVQQKDSKKIEVKEQKLQIVNNLNNVKKDQAIRIKVQKKVDKNGQKNQNKGLCSKKNSVKVIKSPQVFSNLQIMSQQAKKKIVLQRKMQKKPEKQKKKQPKRSQVPKPIDKPQQKFEIMQQQKCNNNQQDILTHTQSDNYNYFNQQQDEIDDYYNNQSFQSYQQQSQQNDFQLSLSTSNEVKGNNYHKMLEEIHKINKLVHQSQGKMQELPMFGEEIPEIFNFTDQVRDDDSQLQSAKSNVDPLQTSEQIITPKTQELEHLRMNLQLILGVQSVIFAYHTISNEIEQHGLDLDEQQTIQKILKGCPEMDQSGIRNYFRLIVTIITIQNKHA